MNPWREWLRAASPGVPAAQGRAPRWVVLAAQTSGRNRRQDRLVAIGAVAVHERRIVPADSIELTLRQAHEAQAGESDLGTQARHTGVEARIAMRQFVDYIGMSPLLAFHAAVDRGLLVRATSAWLDGMTPANLWIDVAGLARALFPHSGASSRDEWLAEFGIAAAPQRNACADAFATAMLFLRLLAALPPDEREPRHMQRIATNARWLGR